MPRPYLRLLRSSDLPLIKELHRELFGFDIVVGDAALIDAVTNPRWTCLAAVQALPGGGEAIAGFVLSVVGTFAEFQQGDYSASHEDSQARSQDTPDAAHDSPSPSKAAHGSPSMGLEQLSLTPDDVLTNVCLLATLPEYRRQGVASLLFSQVISSARNARAKSIFLHVRDNNTPAIAFYKRLGFKTVTTVPGFYQLTEHAAQPSSVADALLLSGAVADVISPSQAASSSGSTEAYLSTAGAQPPRPRAAAQPAAGAGAAAPAAPAKPVAPKMRGLMGPGSGARRQRPADRNAGAGKGSEGDFFGGLFGRGPKASASPGPSDSAAGPAKAAPATQNSSSQGLLGALSGFMGQQTRPQASKNGQPASEPGSASSRGSEDNVRLPVGQARDVRSQAVRSRCRQHVASRQCVARPRVSMAHVPRQAVRPRGACVTARLR